MDTYFAQLFGLYFIIVGLIVLVRRSSLMPTMRELVQSRALLLLIAVVELVAGLALVLAYSTVSFSIPGLISLVGYIMVIEGILYLAAPMSSVRRFMQQFNRPEWYVGGGVVSVILGLYMAGVGFGFM